MTTFALSAAPLERQRSFIGIVIAVALVLSTFTVERRFIQPVISVVTAIVVVASGLTLDSLQLPSPDPELCDPAPIELPHVENPDMPGQLPRASATTQTASAADLTLGCDQRKPSPR
jgi:hypothetical protein